MSALAQWQAQHARVQDAPAAPWLRALRADAWQRFAAQGLPGRRDEDWKYTRLNALERVPAGTAPLPQTAPAGLPEGARLVFAGGRLVSAWSTLPAAAGVTVTNLADALAADGEALRARLRADANAPARAFAWLNDALF